MNSFFKIGLPWAISIGIVFFLGLKLGDSTRYISNETKQIQSSVGSKIEPEKKGVSKNINILVPTQEDYIKSEKFAKSPPLPPNLIRIMEGADVLERMGSYLDALRSMDSSNVQDVVGAFEALPAGYGRHLEMKLLMRSWSAIDPESALKYAEGKTG